jgi:hypothetical protein
MQNNNICVYPGCTDLNAGIGGRICVDNAVRRFKITDDYFSGVYHETWRYPACGMRNISNIWYTGRRCVQFNTVFIHDMLFINKNCIIEYSIFNEPDKIYNILCSRYLSRMVYCCYSIKIIQNKRSSLSSLSIYV